MERLIVLYDGRCGFCVRCRRWLARQAQIVKLEFVSAGSLEARTRFPKLDHGETAEELVVVDDAGGVYRGPDAWIMCLYALEDYRDWSVRLAAPALKPFARAAFDWISSNRRDVSRALGLAPEPEVAAALEPLPSPVCGLPEAE